MGREDLEICRGVLGTLHSLGIVYSYCHLERESFLIIEGDGGEKRALMQGFAYSEFSHDEVRKQAEMDRLPAILASELLSYEPGFEGEVSDRDSDSDDVDYEGLWGPTSGRRLRSITPTQSECSV